MVRAALPAITTLLILAVVAAAPPVPSPPPDFAQPQSPPKPPPFEVKYVDQGQFDPKLKGLLAPEGFQVELVADAPTVINPVGLTFAPDGTLFVIEWAPDPGREWYEFKETFHYRDGTKKAVATMKKFSPDPVKQLKFNAKTNTYDQAEVIFTDELPSTLLFHDGWLYTASRGTVRRYRQSVVGGKWDIRETIAQGFCGFHHHQVSGLTMGPDGWLYITSGDDDNFAEGSDGSRATVLRTGAVFRCKPDGTQLETYSLGYRNPYRDLALDDKGNWFHADNDNEDGSRFTGCRLVHVAEDVDYGWRLLEGARCCRPDHGRGAVAGERPGKMMPMLKTGRGSPAGVLLYHDTQLPEQYRGLMYYPDVFRRVVRAYKTAPMGSTFRITHEFEFLKSDDPLFRPCQMVTGPDGAIYVCDWRTDSGGAGKLWGDGKNGRIYRMKWIGTKELPAIPLRPMNTWTVFAQSHSPRENLLAGVRSADATTRRLAQSELLVRSAKQPDEIRKVLLTLCDTKEPLPTRLLAIAGLGAVWNDTAHAQVNTLLKDEQADVRRVACELLGRNSKPNDFNSSETLKRALEDSSPAVRRSAALALGRQRASGSADAILAAWHTDDGKDAFLSDAYLRGLERLGKPGMQALLALAQSGDAGDLKKVITAFTALRSVEAYAAIPELLGNAHVDAAQKATLIRSYFNYQFDPALPPDALATFLNDRPDETIEVKQAGMEVLAALGGLNGPMGAKFVLSLIDSKDDAIRMVAWSAVEQGKVLQAQPKLRQVVADAQVAEAVRIAAIKAGRAIGGFEFAAVLKDVLAAGKESSTVKIEALRALAALDATSARTQAERLLAQPEPNLIAEAIAVLSATKDGAKLVGTRYLENKLPREFFPRVSDALRKFSTDREIAKLNTDVMRGGLLLSLQPDQIEKIRKDLQANGDAKRGKAIYLNTAQLACATCHKLEGIGGAVGPDLTRLWDTITLEKLLESMVMPSKEIKEGYQSFNALTLDGQSYTGLKITETAAEVVIREATGRDVKIPKANLDVLKSSNQSLMPDNVVSQLSYTQFIDLIAFLKSKTEQEGLRGQLVEATWIHGLPADLKEHPAEIQIDLAKPPVGIKAQWQPIGIDALGFLQLRSLLPSTPSGYLVVSYVYSPKKQAVQVTLLVDDPMRITMGGKKPAFERDVPKHSKFEEMEQFKVELEAGWTPIVIRGFSTGSTHRIGLQLQGDGVRTSARPEK